MSQVSQVSPVQSRPVSRAAGCSRRVGLRFSGQERLVRPIEFVHEIRHDRCLRPKGFDSPPLGCALGRCELQRLPGVPGPYAIMDQIVEHTRPTPTPAFGRFDRIDRPVGEQVRRAMVRMLVSRMRDDDDRRPEGQENPLELVFEVGAPISRAGNHPFRGGRTLTTSVRRGENRAR